MSPLVTTRTLHVRRSLLLRLHDPSSGGGDHKACAIPRVADHRAAGIRCEAVGLVTCFTCSRSSPGRAGWEGRMRRVWARHRQQSVPT